MMFKQFTMLYVTWQVQNHNKDHTLNSQRNARALFQYQLQQPEQLRSEDTPRRLMMTHSIESYWIPSQKKIKSKLQIKRIRQNFNFF